MKRFFKNKTVIITGHTGFKGSWLSLVLIHLGAKVIGISNNIPSKPSFFQILKLGNKLKDLRADVRNLQKLKKIFKKYKPDYVFHLAAQSLVKKSFKEPVYTFTTNFVGTLNILESLRALNKKCISVIITSDKSYKNFEIDRGYKESDILGGEDPYSASKGSAELVIQSYCKSFFKDKKKRIGIARAGNVIGGGDWSENRLIPDCIKSWSIKKRVILRNPKSTRPWQHVFEAIFGYLTLATRLKKDLRFHGEAFNFGPSNRDNKSVLNVVTEMKKSWKAVSWKIKKFEKIDYESKLLKLNSNKAKLKLKWKNCLNFSQSIKMTTDWYKNFYEKKENIYFFSINQILNFEKKMRSK
jgi:CDP-glucose 4,6-dehydratase